jgi:hypothetical protein
MGAKSIHSARHERPWLRHFTPLEIERGTRITNRLQSFFEEHIRKVPECVSVTCNILDLDGEPARVTFELDDGSYPHCDEYAVLRHHMPVVARIMWLAQPRVLAVDVQNLETKEVITMPHDRNGALLQAGDKVIFEGTIEQVYENCEACNLNVKAAHPKEGFSDTVTLTAAWVEKVPEPDTVGGAADE